MFVSDNSLLYFFVLVQIIAKNIQLQIIVKIYSKIHSILFETIGTQFNPN